MRALAIACALAACACESPSYEDGNLRCAAVEPRCPAGLHCAADGTCWHDGRDPDLAGTGDAGGPSIDLFTVDECVAPVCECGTVVTPCGNTFDCGGDCSSKSQICGAGGLPNFCGCPPAGRVGVYRKLSPSGANHCLTAYPDNDCPGYMLESTTPKFYAYEGDPVAGTNELVLCFDGNAYSASEDSGCNGLGANANVGVVGYVAPSTACGAVPLHRYQVAGANWFFTTNTAEAPAGVSETMPPYFVWTSP